MALARIYTVSYYHKGRRRYATGIRAPDRVEAMFKAGVPLNARNIEVSDKRGDFDPPKQPLVAGRLRDALKRKPKVKKARKKVLKHKTKHAAKPAAKHKTKKGKKAHKTKKSKKAKK